MPLFKILLDIVLTAGFIAMLTPPHSTPPEGEIKPSTAIDIISLRKYRLNIARIGQLILAGAEIITILSQANPSLGVSQRSLSNQSTRIGLNSISIFGAILWIFGAGLRLKAFGNLGPFFRFDISIQNGHKLIVTGPYSYVRHPSYSGLLVSIIGWFLWYGAKGSWLRESGILETSLGRAIFLAYVIVGILPLCVVTLSRMSREDTILRKQFGEEWDNWAKKVPYLIAPGIY